MAYARKFTDQLEPPRAEVEAGEGWLLLEFGTDWCGHCAAAQPVVKDFVEKRALDHRKIEDGKGRPLGRAFTVKLWPTLILLRDGREVGRVVRPTAKGDLEVLERALG